MADDKYASVQDFLNDMDRGDFEGGYSGFSAEIGKLSREQLEEVAAILVERYSRGGIGQSSAVPLSTHL